MKTLKAQLDELADRQIVERCMELAGMAWAYNQLSFFEGRDTELNQIRREAKALRYGDMRRTALIEAAIEATVAAWRGKPIIYDGEGIGDLEDPVASNDQTEGPRR
jgi:hypothetical protein